MEPFSSDKATIKCTPLFIYKDWIAIEFQMKVTNVHLCARVDLHLSCFKIFTLVLLYLLYEFSITTSSYSNLIRLWVVINLSQSLNFKMVAAFSKNFKCSVIKGFHLNPYATNSNSNWVLKPSILLIRFIGYFRSKLIVTFYEEFTGVLYALNWYETTWKGQFWNYVVYSIMYILMKKTLTYLELSGWE